MTYPPGHIAAVFKGLGVFYGLKSRLEAFGSRLSRDPENPERLDYLMALFSQVAYAPTRFEAQNARKTSVIPSSFFQHRAMHGRSADIAHLIRMSFGEEFASAEQVITGNSVTTLMRFGNAVIIASRGTVLFHELLHPFRDAAIDLNAWHIPFGDQKCRYHFGFLEEASASLPAILEAYNRVCGGRGMLPIYFTGHSLGGALSAVMDRLWPTTPPEHRTTIVFGCPRFGNQAAMDMRPLRALERQGDPVPALPPTFLGYADPTTRVPLAGPDRISRIRLHKNHSMERYRRAVAEREGLLADDDALYRLLEIAVAPKRRGPYL